jgi:hypothetical protein
MISLDKLNGQQDIKCRGEMLGQAVRGGVLAENAEGAERRDACKMWTQAVAVRALQLS